MNVQHFEAEGGPSIRFAVSERHGDKPWVALVLPFGLELTAAARLVDALAGDFAVVTWESRLILVSEDVEVSADELSVEEHVRDMLSLLQAVAGDEPVDLIGYCSGAGIALAAANRAPPRFRRLILVSGEFLLRDEPNALTSHARDVDSLLPVAARSVEHAGKVFSLIRQASDIVPETDAPVAVTVPYSRPAYLHRYALNYLSYGTTDFRALARSTHQETLVIAGRADAQTNVASANAIRKELARSRLHIETDGDHYALLNVDDGYLRAVRDFLGAGAPKSAEASRVSNHDDVDATIHGIFERRAQMTPDATASIFAGTSLSYARLNARANFLAANLVERGVVPGDTVALSMQRSHDMLVAMLGILKCGAAYLPFDDGNPPALTRACLQRAGAQLVIVDRDPGAVPEFDLPAIHTASRELFCSERHDDLRVDATPESKAYILFTSGSTGPPKGVVVPHRAVVRLVRNPNYIDIAADDCFLQFAPVTFDASTFEIWGALLNGARLVLYSGAVLDPNLLQREIADNRVTILWLTAALFHLVGTRYSSMLRPLKALLAGGDVLNPDVVNKVLDSHSNLIVINGYGPTENTTFTCCHRMSRDSRPNGAVPIGRPINGTEIHVLDPNRAPVPVGEVGELYVSGRGVALGYLEAADAFFVDPKIAGGLIYRTGDLVRETPGGEVEFIGRTDKQVKIRGYRVSLEHVERCLMQLPRVDSAAVVAMKSDMSDHRLVAYLQPKPKATLSAEEIRRNLGASVPPYMVPDLIEIRSELPINRNGKIDRGRLSPADRKRPEAPPAPAGRP